MKEAPVGCLQALRPPETETVYIQTLFTDFDYRKGQKLKNYTIYLTILNQYVLQWGLSDSFVPPAPGHSWRRAAATYQSSNICTYITLDYN